MTTSEQKVPPKKLFSLLVAKKMGSYFLNIIIPGVIFGLMVILPLNIFILPLLIYTHSSFFEVLMFSVILGIGILMLLKKSNKTFSSLSTSSKNLQEKRTNSLDRKVSSSSFTSSKNLQDKRTNSLDRKTSSSSSTVKENIKEKEQIREIHVFIHGSGDDNIGLEIVRSLRPTCLLQAIKPKIIMHNIEGEWPP